MTINKTLILFLVLILVACSSQAPAATSMPISPTEVPVSPTPTTAPIEPTAEPTTPPSEPTQAPQEGGLTTYQIITGESKVTYEVGEIFLNQGNAFNVAVGVATGITGQVAIDRDNPQNSTLSTIEVDISQFKSDSNRRDNAIRDRFLQSSTYPIATFVPKEIQGLPSTGQEGQEYSLEIIGDLTVRQTTRLITFNTTVKLVGDTLTGSATTTLLMSDFGVGPISIAGILNTEDEVKLTFEFIARS